MDEARLGLAVQRRQESGAGSQADGGLAGDMGKVAESSHPNTTHPLSPADANGGCW